MYLHTCTPLSTNFVAHLLAMVAAKSKKWQLDAHLSGLKNRLLLELLFLLRSMDSPAMNLPSCLGPRSTLPQRRMYSHPFPQLPLRLCSPVSQVFETLLLEHMWYLSKDCCLLCRRALPLSCPTIPTISLSDERLRRRDGETTWSQPASRTPGSGIGTSPAAPCTSAQ